ncbi:MAG: GNAT family N-acetyltransferase [Timaviella obliquedivisa GSE-PSE-MK23-08B]|jgi:GNAT superfamily N-acetyltransferase|nr:GNAT family N-acetyltransferase [Timaviella obliquedivisa GSE-PSE-MK23-08B]
MEVILARSDHLEEVAKLFDQYRVFYQQRSDLEAARQFLEQRFESQDSILLLAREAEQTVGFTQLYPSFSSISMQRVWILNDLFVAESHRGQGIAKLLMGRAEKYARQTDAVRIILATQISNAAAQTLYESLGYIKDEMFYHYALRLGKL